MCEDSIAWAFITWVGAILAALAVAVCSVWALRLMSECWFWVRYRRQQRKAHAQTAKEAAWFVAAPPVGLPILAKVHLHGPCLGVVEGGRFHGPGFSCPAENVLGWIRVPGTRAKKGGPDHGRTVEN